MSNVPTAVITSYDPPAWAGASGAPEPSGGIGYFRQVGSIIPDDVGRPAVPVSVIATDHLIVGEGIVSVERGPPRCSFTGWH